MEFSVWLAMLENCDPPNENGDVVLKLAAGLLAVPVPAPGVIVITGYARISVDEGCLARVVRKDYKVAVKPGKKMELPVGTYRLTVRPGACERSKTKFTVRKGKTVRASVTNPDLGVSL